ncbi:acetyl-CoA acetyltransferase [Desulfuromonas versatilis]|uniref:Acetyl-CoA acetyltransferase n=1 Tax=Desulfuromonas versatilis TaxID=2802975 RepID=A0ABM8HQ95_9BACT|nr:acetyl-CoA C-acetyltransferase [Desulfuromonas versatilis]BCR04279.1 acetyl-CoA acetyltransferase [Desulfuromonas versatilis]
MSNGASNPAAREGRNQRRPVYIVDGARTPFLKVRGRPGPFTPVDLAVQCGRPLLLRQGAPLDAYDQVILGCVNVLSGEMNPARIAALRLGMGERTRAFTVQINCGSGMQSVDTAYKYIRDGACELVLAGGAEALSHAPLMVRPETVEWLADLRQADSLPERAARIGDWRPRMFKPVMGLEQGLTDPVVGLSMGQTAEVLAHLFGIGREQADRYALRSHQRLARAQAEGWLDGEIEAAISADGEIFERDDGVRPDTSLEALTKLKPVFEPPYGQVTAGNSSQVTDGASWLILASEDAVEKYRLSPKARIIDSEWAALDPKIMGLAPVLAASALLGRHGLGLEQMELWELNEAFAAQVLACLAAWEDGEFCREVLGRDGPLGRIDPERLNIDGGAVALGHPVGASGNRIVLHLVNALRRTGARLGLATECIGGGQAGAMLIEALQEGSP